MVPLSCALACAGTKVTRALPAGAWGACPSGLDGGTGVAVAGGELTPGSCGAVAGGTLGAMGDGVPGELGAPGTGCAQGRAPPSEVLQAWEFQPVFAPHMSDGP